MAEEYQKRGVAVVGINSNDFKAFPDDAPGKMAEEIDRRNYTFPYLVDESQAVAKAYRAACTPDFFVFDRDRRLVYRGQMDSSRPGNDLPVTGKELGARWTPCSKAGRFPASSGRASVATSSGSRETNRSISAKERRVAFRSAKGDNYFHADPNPAGSGLRAEASLPPAQRSVPPRACSARVGLSPGWVAVAAPADIRTLCRRPFGRGRRRRSNFAPHLPLDFLHQEVGGLTLGQDRMKRSKTPLPAGRSPPWES